MTSYHLFLMNTPLLGVLLFMLVTVLSALICYGVTRKLLLSRMGEDSEMLSGKIFARLGALHALILALMFAQEMADYRDISRIVTKEASAISDVYDGLQEYDKENQQSAAALSNLIVDYVKTAMEADRIALADDRLSNQTWINYHRIYRQLRKLQPTNNDQEYLRAEMLKDWDIVSEFHQRLRSIVEYEAPSFFWIVIITGFFAVVVRSKPASIHLSSNGLSLY